MLCSTVMTPGVVTATTVLIERGSTLKQWNSKITGFRNRNIKVKLTTELHGVSQEILSMSKLLYSDLTYKIIGAAKEVYQELGPGYLESVYEGALCYELDLINIPYQRRIDLDVH
jgi:hypothetical protein